eukprot:2861075-Amphidinium_carterae.1
MEQDENALTFAADALLLDSTFASEAKKQGFILKVSLLSGRYACQFVQFVEEVTGNNVLSFACEALGIERRGAEVLVSGADVIPLDALVRDWPGLRPLGDISEFQLVVHQHA